MPSEGASPRTPRSSAAREIVDALERAAIALVSGSPELPSVRALSRKAGVALGSFYQYFRNREDLLVRIVLVENTKLAARVCDAIAAHAPTTVAADVERFTMVMREWRSGHAWLSLLPLRHLFRPELITTMVSDSRGAFREMFALLERRHGLRPLSIAEQTFIVSLGMMHESLHVLRVAGRDEEAVFTRIMLGLLEGARSSVDVP